MRLNSNNVCNHSALNPIYKPKIIIVPVCENLLLILREEYRLRLYENMVLKKIFEPKKE